ncbi:hypothetical protein ABKV19_025999, partial [Rosa sericea]
SCFHNMDNIDEEEFYFYQDVCLLLRTVEYYHDTYLVKTPCMNSDQTGNRWIMELLVGHESCCYRMFRMEKHVFVRLYNDLQDNYGLTGSKNICPAEIVGMFVHMLGHGVGNIVCRMAIDVIKPPDPEKTLNEIPDEISRDTRYMPHFK